MRTLKNNIAQHVGHTPVNNKSCSHGFSRFIFDILLPCYGQLTPVKTWYMLTSIMWPYHGLRLSNRSSRSKYWFLIGYHAHVGFICCDQGCVVGKRLNPNPGLQANQSIKSSFIQMFSTAFGSWAPDVVLSYSKSKHKVKQYRQKNSPQSYTTQSKIVSYPGLV